MGGGFSFCGVDISKLKLEYAPENKDTYVYNTFDYDIDDQSFTGHDGGYFYGTTLKPKQFILRCFYEDTEINSGLMSNIDSFFYRGRTGRLVFDKRSWAYYVATVVKVEYGTMYSHYNGVIIIRMNAYNPYAFTDYSYISDPKYEEDMKVNSAMLLTDSAPPVEINISEHSSVGYDILLYNGGTKQANVTIDIGGNVGTDGIIIANNNNKQDCMFIGLKTGSASEYVECDGSTGNCYWVGGSNDGKPAFLYHSYGFIQLEPSFPIVRDFSVSAHTSEERLSIIHTTNEFTEDMIDKYICLSFVDSSGVSHSNEYVRIVEIENANTAVVSANIDTLSTTVTDVLNMNKIHITTSEGTSDIYLRFKYKHTFA